MWRPNRPYRRTWSEWFKDSLVAVALLAAIYYGVVAPVLESARNPKGPYRERIPSKPPVEANRITHEAGFSIVAPENWDRVPDFAPDWNFLLISARGRPAGRRRSTIQIEPLATPPVADALKHCLRTEFQQLPAYSRMDVVRQWSLDDPAYSEYELYVDRRGQWWRISFGINEEMTDLPPEVRQYIDTIRFPDSPAAERLPTTGDSARPADVLDTSGESDP